MIKSEFIKEEGGDPVEGVGGVDDDHEDEPEPHRQVHLLIDDVLKDNDDDNAMECLCQSWVTQQGNGKKI